MTPISDQSLNITSKDSLKTKTANENNHHEPLPDKETDQEEARVLSNSEFFQYYCKKTFTVQTLKKEASDSDEPNYQEQKMDLEEARVLSNSEFFKILGKIDDE